MRIALLEDDPVQQELLERTLTQQLNGKYALRCQRFTDGKQLQKVLRRESFDLLILDWSVPTLDGMELLRWLRIWKSSRVPVLMLSSRGGERDVVDALGAGADDYMVKPFRPLELGARVLRLLLQGHTAAGRPIQSVGRWTLDPSGRSVGYAAQPGAEPETHTLTAREFQFAQLLFGRVGQTVSRAHLLEAAGYEAGDNLTRTLDSHIYRLRRKLGLDASRGVSLCAVYGQGYCLELVKDVST